MSLRHKNSDRHQSSLAKLNIR